MRAFLCAFAIIGTLLTLCHFVVTFFGLLICASLNVFQIKRLPILQLLPLCFSFWGYVVLNNLRFAGWRRCAPAEFGCHLPVSARSIQYNSVGFYQTVKISITPTVCLIEFFLHHKRFSRKITISLVTVCVGIGLATISDFRVNVVGSIYGVTSVIVTAFYQIVCDALLGRG